MPPFDEINHEMMLKFPMLGFSEEYIYDETKRDRSVSVTHYAAKPTPDTIVIISHRRCGYGDKVYWLQIRRSNRRAATSGSDRIREELLLDQRCESPLVCAAVIHDFIQKHTGKTPNDKEAA